MANDDNQLFSGPEGIPNSRIVEVNARALSVAAFPVKVLLLGETGTGKSRLARYIHDNSGRVEKCKSVCKEVWESLSNEKLKIMLARMWAERSTDKYIRKEYLEGKLVGQNLIESFEKRLVEEPNGVQLEGSGLFEVNLAALPKTTISSELFGYVGGAFTDADAKGSPGFFIQANGGTLFLDEIADCPENIQALLLEVLQPKSANDGDSPCYVIPTGQTDKIRVNVRLICATNKDLKQMVDGGKFRADLYYRLREYELSLPPLRELKYDYRIESFGERLAKLLETPKAKDEFSENDLKVFKDVVSLEATTEDKEKLVEHAAETFFRRFFIHKELETVNDKLVKVNNVEGAAKYLRKELAEDALSALLKYDFKGNYRELQSCLMQACMNAHADCICNAYMNGEKNPSEDTPTVKWNHLPDFIRQASGGKEEQRQLDMTVEAAGRSGTEVPYSEEDLIGPFSPEEAECVSEQLKQGVCSFKSLKAVIDLKGFKRGGDGDKILKRDFSDIWSFLRLIGCVEQNHEINMDDAARKVCGPTAKRGRIETTLLPKFGILFSALQDAIKNSHS